VLVFQLYIVFTIISLIYEGIAFPLLVVLPLGVVPECGRIPQYTSRDRMPTWKILNHYVSTFGFDTSLSLSSLLDMKGVRQ